VKIYTVKKGDTLSGIAAKHGVTLQDLLQHNPGIQNPDVIDVGMKIKIPASKSPAPSGDWMHQHKVVQGDTLWKLSKAWGVPLADLIKANPQLKNPNVLMTGEIVNIPKPGWQAPAGGVHGHHPGQPQELQHIAEGPVPGKKFTGVKSPMPPIEQPKPIELGKLDLPAAPKMEMPKPISQPKPQQVDWTKLPKPVPLPMPQPIQKPVQPYCPEPQYPVHPAHHHAGYPAGLPDAAKHPFQPIHIPSLEAFAQPGAGYGAGYGTGAAWPAAVAGTAPWGADPAWTGHDWTAHAAVHGWPGLTAYASVGMPCEAPWPAGAPGAVYPDWHGWHAPGSGEMKYAGDGGDGEYRNAGLSGSADGSDAAAEGGDDPADGAAAKRVRTAAKAAGSGKAKKASVRSVSGRASSRPKQRQEPKKRSGQPWINSRY
jgi:LysM repeat protein